MRLQASGFRLQASGFRLQAVILYCSLLIFLCGLIGCDAFVRKFTRKPKKEDFPKEEMVLQPEEYKAPQMSKEELYRQYFLFWKSWQDELINGLAEKLSQKKQLACAEEAIKNLEQIKLMLDAKAQNILEVYLDQLKELQELIKQDLYGSSLNSYRLKAERIRRNILRDLSYNKIKNSLV
jgi:hypothetical protein